jgi:hypothetical protein
MARKENIKARPRRPLDRFNDPVGDLPAWREIPGATVVPRNSHEDEQRGPIVISGFMIVLPSRVTDLAGLPVALEETWEFEIRGDVYQVEGDIADYGRKLIFYTMRAS